MSTEQNYTAALSRAPRLIKAAGRSLADALAVATAEAIPVMNSLPIAFRLPAAALMELSLSAAHVDMTEVLSVRPGAERANVFALHPKPQ